MPNKKVSDLSALSTLSSEDSFYVVHEEMSYKSTVDVFRQYVSTLPNLLSFPNIDSTGVTDSTVGVQSAINAAGHGLFIPKGTYKITGVINVPNNFVFYGEGRSSCFKMTGIDPGNEATDYNMFTLVSGTASNVVFDGIGFKGENSPFVYDFQGQSAAIFGAAAGGNASGHISIRHCWFEDLYGLPVYIAARGDRLEVTDNRFLNCANGVVSGIHRAVYARNYGYNFEGFEVTGDHQHIIDNVLYNLDVDMQLHGVISIGGIISTGVYTDDTLCCGNILYGAYIALAENCKNPVVENNKIIQPVNQGIIASVNVAGLSLDIINPIIRNNVIIDPQGAAGSGIVLNPDVLNALVENNDISGGVYGMRVRSSGHTIISNRVSGTSNYPVYIYNNAADVRCAGNDCVVQVAAGSNILPYCGQIQSEDKSVPVLISPDGSTFMLQVDNAGALSTVEL